MVVSRGLDILLHSQTMHTVYPRTPDVERRKLDVNADCADHEDRTEAAYS
jgi:hypothetical protein